MFSLVFHPGAEADYNEAYSWYLLQKPGLEDRFEFAVKDTLDKLRVNPQYFGYIKKPFRQVLVKVFPYVIVFRINYEDNTVYISSIFHTSRNPKEKYRKETE